MSELTPEEIVRRRMLATPPVVDPFEAGYAKLLEDKIPRALKRIAKKNWEGWENKIIAQFGKERGEPDRECELAVYKLTPAVSLTSRGTFALHVVDPLGELPYDMAEVDQAYMVKNHSNRKTLNYLHQTIDRL